MAHRAAGVMREAPAAGMRSASPRVLVVGAGWAGCAAALHCARQGARVTVHEAARVPGGRARTVERDGLLLDNGQHLLLGAYAGTLALLERLGASNALSRSRLALRPLHPAQPHALGLAAARLPAPLGLAAALCRARGLRIGERLAALRAFAAWKRAGFQCAPGATVADLLAPLPPAVARRLWTPLCLAALNTPPPRASAQVFLAVLQASFDAAADAADALLPALPLSQVLPQPALAQLAAQGHRVALGSRVRIVASTADAVVASTGSATPETFDAAIVAVGPHQLAATLDAGVHARPGVAAALTTVARFEYEPITTVYLGYREAALALPKGLVRLDDDPGQWLFDRSDLLPHATRDAPGLAQLLAVVISASGPHDGWPQAQLAAAAQRQLARSVRLPPADWTQVIAERRATYACTPGLAHPNVQADARLFLAGDYLYPRFPATLESAVRSGEAAAAAALQALHSGAGSALRAVASAADA